MTRTCKAALLSRLGQGHAVPGEGPVASAITNNRPPSRKRLRYDYAVEIGLCGVAAGSRLQRPLARSYGNLVEALTVPKLGRDAVSPGARQLTGRPA